MMNVVSGLLLAVVIGAAVLYAIPAAWVVRYVTGASDGRVVLAHARGLWHRGSALLVLTSGAGGADAVHWLRRVHWEVSPRAPWRWLIRITWPESGPPLTTALGLYFPGWTLDTEPWSGTLPLAALAGLGAPFNTLALTGEAQVSLGALQFSSSNDTASAQAVPPNAEITITQLRSALAQGVVLGDYTVRGHATSGGATFDLTTRQGALLLDGRGQCVLKSRLSCNFNGTARAARHDDALLGNLLGLLGKSQPQAQALVGSTLNGTTSVTELRW